ncbi:MAG: DUF1802 family protein [Candidatus Omnitrophota bacterium]|nr:DUF1802 family protein [Candidatus Omnitrophota bacterium]
MSRPVLPATCQVALKEWASVLAACARGEQLVFIRKGGLIEPGSGFEFRAPHFLLYPTYEHQTVTFLRSPFQALFEEAMGHLPAAPGAAQAGKPADGHVTFELCGEMVYATQSRDADLLKRLEPFHIYNDAFMSQRLRWQPDQPLVIGVIRVLRLPAPVSLPLSNRYAGCKSWVELEQAVSLAGAVPVLDDAVFSERLSRIQALLKPPEATSAVCF